MLIFFSSLARASLKFCAEDYVMERKEDFKKFLLTHQQMMSRRKPEKAGEEKVRSRSGKGQQTFRLQLYSWKLN